MTAVPAESLDVVRRLAAVSPRYAALLDTLEGRTPPAAKSLPTAASPVGGCGHRGGPTGRTVQCPTCTGRVELKVFACGAHGECTPAKRAPGVACCVGCPDRVPTDQSTERGL